MSSVLKEMLSNHLLLSKLTLQKQMGFSQPLHPSRQSLLHGHALNKNVKID